MGVAETDGEQHARMDRVERAMEMFAADRKLLIAQVVQQGETSCSK